ncbi:hypothetical protein SBV1_2800013 [Verrucomicrobia bacterium]|nr:hypothetical protein SBV1_2800013 [Verrucomicrobiota bacterium]
MPLRQPENLQHLVSFEETLLVETLEKGQVMRVQIPSSKGRDQRFDFLALVAQSETNLTHQRRDAN